MFYSAHFLNNIAVFFPQKDRIDLLIINEGLRVPDFLLELFVDFASDLLEIFSFFNDGDGIFIRFHGKK